MTGKTIEETRLAEDASRSKYWKRWGPYLSERQWATVREDYSDNGDAWSHFTYEDALSRAFRWGEDGIAGISDSHGLQCISFAFWNEKDDFLKERLFGLTSHEGNHGEDVKESYFYLDNTPTHSYMNYLYKYPQKKFPYEELRKVNGSRSRDEPEFELVDTGIFNESRYFDIYIETAKLAHDPESLVFRVTAYNRGPEPASLHVVPQAFFRNTWSWGDDYEEDHYDTHTFTSAGKTTVESNHEKLGERVFHFEETNLNEILFTDNESNKVKLWGDDQKNLSKFTKDAFHEYICNENKQAVNPEKTGTKMAAWYEFKDIPAGGSASLHFTFSKKENGNPVDAKEIDTTIEDRLDEADDFYYHVSPLPISDELRSIQRQAFAGMLWNKQYYEFIWGPWARGDLNATTKPSPNRIHIRNESWKHLHIDDILSMPDKWEYPFFAAWDTAFHCIPLAMIDPEFAKKQLDLMVREWYMHPNGQLPAYEWNFSDVNPPVHAWATYRVFKIQRRLTGEEDYNFLERVFQKLLFNFTWWVNCKDANGQNVFEGGFLGLDNIGLFNRSEPLPTGGTLEQADGTGWMGFYCLQMLNIALELSKHRPVYEDIASKFFEHFLFIADAMSYAGESEDDANAGNGNGNTNTGGLWNEEDGFYYDRISWGPNNSMQLPVRSLVGLIPLFASLTIDSEILTKYPKFARRIEWFVKHRPMISARNLASLRERGKKGRLLLSLVNRERLERILHRMLDPDEFLSDYGIRSLSKYHKDHPYSMEVNGSTFVVDYQPGDSNSAMFGGNSNWRGPIWFPTNFLLIESLQRFFLFYGDELKVKCPSNSDKEVNLAKAAEEIQRRLIGLFTRNELKDNRRPYNGGVDLFDRDDNFDELFLFNEFFDPDTGRGLGTSHQNGWTGLVAKMIHDTGMVISNPKTFSDNPAEAATEFFDDVWEVKTPRSRHHSRPVALSRSSSTHRIVQNIGELLRRYNIEDDALGHDLESSQNEN